MIRGEQTWVREDAKTKAQTLVDGVDVVSALQHWFEAPQEAMEGCTAAAPVENPFARYWPVKAPWLSGAVEAPRKLLNPQTGPRPRKTKPNCPSRFQGLPEEPFPAPKGAVSLSGEKGTEEPAIWEE